MRSKAAYWALGMLPDGKRDILDLWIDKPRVGKYRAHKYLI